MKVLIACEESQRVCIEFRKLGAEAYSADIQECSGGHPEWHIKGDVIEVLHNDWDLIIAHPPCTYLSCAGSRHLYPAGIGFDYDRYKKGLAAKDFFMVFYNHPCEHIAIENPVPITQFNLPNYTQIIQPYMFGEPYQKRTCLWLKGLPKLVPTDNLGFGVSTKKAEWFNKHGKDRQKNRSKTFKGIAEAMATQWYKYLKENGYD